MYRKVLLFAGTTEGRQLYGCLRLLQIPSVVYVVTEYGEQLLESGDSAVRIHVGRLEKDQMEAELYRERPELVLDATHPYAVLASRNIREACDSCRIPYLRVIREPQQGGRDEVWVNSMPEAAEWLNRQPDGGILVTTGSKELPELAARIRNRERLVVRILPSTVMLRQCEELGLKGSQLICMQGPFSEEMNYLIMKEKNIAYLLTKESGAAGGFREKLQAAKRAGATAVVIGRPDVESGYTAEQVERLLNGFGG